MYNFAIDRLVAENVFILEFFSRRAERQLGPHDILDEVVDRHQPEKVGAAFDRLFIGVMGRVGHIEETIGEAFAFDRTGDGARRGEEFLADWKARRGLG